jgi:hypothetical protein
MEFSLTSISFERLANHDLTLRNVTSRKRQLL